MESKNKDNEKSFEEYIIEDRDNFIKNSKCIATPEQKCSVMDDIWCDDCDYRVLISEIKEK